MWLRKISKRRTTKVLTVALILPILLWPLTNTSPQSNLSTYGAQRIIVVQVGFSDLRPLTPRYLLYDLVFNQLDAYVRENSLGRSWIEGDVAEHPVQLNSTLSDYYLRRGESTLYEFRRLAVDAIRSSSKVVNYGGYDRLILIFAGNVSAVWVNDLDVRVSDKAAWRQAIVVGEENLSLAVLAHELGHEFGLPDLYADEKSLATKEGPYRVGTWCIMSYSSNLIGMCAWSRLKLGWLASSEVTELLPGQNAVVQLAPTTAPVDGQRALKIKITDSKYFLAEVRTKTGSDLNIPAEGMLVNFIDESSTPNQVRLQDAHPFTETLRDAAFSMSTGGNPVFMDQETGRAIVILGKQNQIYKIHVTEAAEGNAAIKAHEKLMEVESMVRRYGYEISSASLNIVLTLFQNGRQEYFEAKYGRAFEMTEEAKKVLETAVWPEDIRDTFSLIKKIELRIRNADIIGLHYPQSATLLEKSKEVYKLALESWERSEYNEARKHAELASSLALRAWFTEFAHPDPNNEEGVYDYFPG